VIGNNVPYAPYVHDPEQQAPYHRDHGWKTTDDVAESEGPKVVELIRRAISKVIGW
jgi:hypothetical protein